MTAAVTGLGLLIVNELGGVRSFDDRVARWLERHATSTWDDLTFGGSFVADADVKIPAAVILCALFAFFWRRWTEVALFAGALVLEVSVFTLSSFMVDRTRPPIPQLDKIPPTGAFPSGHSAAAVAFYGALAIIVCWHTRNRLVRTIAITAAFVIPVVVAASRMYRGMHHLSDVVVGLVDRARVALDHLARRAQRPGRPDRTRTTERVTATCPWRTNPRWCCRTRRRRTASHS